MLVQRLLGSVVHAGGEADEHLCRIVQPTRHLAAQQGGHDSHASGRGHMGQGGGIERLGLGSEMPEFAIRDAGEHLVRNRLSAQPCKMGQVLAHALRAGARRFRLHLVPCRVGGAFRHDQQGGQAFAYVERHSRRGPAMVGAVDQGSGRAGKLEQRPESWQLAAMAEQFLDAGVDDVGKVVARARGLDARLCCQAAGRTVVARNADEAAHQG
jgi:hypothetical protein